MGNKFYLVDDDNWRKMYAGGLPVIEGFLLEMQDNMSYRLYFKDGTQVVARLMNSGDGDNGLDMNDPDYEELYEFDFRVIKIEKVGSDIQYKEGDWIVLDYRNFFYRFEPYEESI